MPKRVQPPASTSVAPDALRVGERAEADMLSLPSSLLERFTALLVARPTIEEVLEETFAGLRELVDIEYLALLVLEDGRLVPRMACSLDESARGAIRLETNPMLVQSGTVLFNPQFVDDTLHQAQPGIIAPLEASSVASLPLLRGDGVHGLLVAGRFGPARPWTRPQRMTMIAVSRVVAASVERIEGVQSIERAGRESTALLALSRLLEGVSHVHQLRRAALETLRPHFPGASLGLAVLERGLMHLVDFEGDEELALRAGLLEPRAPGDPEVLHALEGRETLWRDEYAAPSADPRWVEAGVGEVAVVPLQPQRGLYSRLESLVALRRARRRPWSELERRLLAAAARTITVAFERIEAAQALSEARERAELLAALSDALQTTQTAEQVAQTAMEWLGPALRADNILTLRLSGDRVHGMGVWGEVPDAYQGYFRREGVRLEATRLTRKIAETGEPIYELGYDRGSSTRQPERRRIAVGLEPIKDTDGHVVAIFSVGRDPRIGEWLPEERELMARAAGTVGLALERARVREALEAQNTALEQKSAEMEAFVYSVSHDLKAPMVSLEGMSTLLLEALEAGDPEETQFFVGRLRANVATMSALVNNLLELSRVGRVDDADEINDLEVVVRGVLDELETAINAKSIHVDLPDHWPSVRYPPSRLYQIWANLIGNAVKFMPPERQDARISVTWDWRDGLEFGVSDNGPGIPPALRGKVFELFTRLDPSVEGTGVGLAMVKRIVESKGGIVRLEDNADGAGARFTFSVPVSRIVMPDVSPDTSLQ
jgi:signal transduction histidine kinase